MASPERFSLEMNLRAEEVERSVNRIVELAGRAIAKEVIATTPVDTSLALSNWTGSLGSPATGTRSAVSPGEFGSTASASGAAAQVAVWNAITGRKTDQDVWISNNLNYINDLNTGKVTPRASPAPDRTPYPRFAERAVLFGAAVVKQNARKIFK
jgi:hypothetical protein